MMIVKTMFYLLCSLNTVSISTPITDLKLSQPQPLISETHLQAFYKTPTSETPEFPILI